MRRCVVLLAFSLPTCPGLRTSQGSFAIGIPLDRLDTRRARREVRAWKASISAFAASLGSLAPASALRLASRNLSSSYSGVKCILSTIIFPFVPKHCSARLLALLIQGGPYGLQHIHKGTSIEEVPQLVGECGKLTNKILVVRAVLSHTLEHGLCGHQVLRPRVPVQLILRRQHFVCCLILSHQPTPDIQTACLDGMLDLLLELMRDVILHGCTRAQQAASEIWKI